MKVINIATRRPPEQDDTVQPEQYAWAIWWIWMIGLVGLLWWLQL